MSIAPTASQRTLPSAYFLLAALSLFWGLNWPVMKVALGAIPVLPFRAICLLASGPTMLAVAALRRDPMALRRHEVGPLLLAAFFNVTLWHVLSAYGVSLLPAGRASIIAYTMPAWAILLARIVLGEPFGLRGALSLGLGMGGIGALLLPELRHIGAAPLGALAMALAAISWAAGTVVMKRFRWGCSVAALTGWQTSLGGLPIVLAAVVAGPFPGLARGDLKTLAALGYIIVFGMLFSQWAWFKVLGQLPVMVASIGSLTIPVIGVLSSALLLGEPIGAPEIVALTLVIAALALALLRPRRWR